MHETAIVNILHVEDDPADAELIGIALRGSGLGCDIRVARSRQECLAALETGTFDLVLSDSHGHDLKGRDVLRLVRGYLPQVPFIFLSGSFDDTDPEMLKVEGAADCIVKDDLDSLISAVRRLLESAR